MNGFSLVLDRTSVEECWSDIRILEKSAEAAVLGADGCPGCDRVVSVKQDRADRRDEADADTRADDPDSHAEGIQHCRGRAGGA